MVIPMLIRSLVLLLALAVPGRAQTVLWEDSFEAGPGAWTASGLWHVVDTSSACLGNVAPFPHGTHAAWYGSEATCNFVGNHAGVLSLIAPVALPAAHDGGVALRYRMWREGEQCGTKPYDWTEARVLDAAGGLLVAQIECESDGAWRKGRIDLVPYLGTSVRVAFSFDTVDESTNLGRGVFLDDVSIELEPGRSFCETLGCPCTHHSQVNSQVGGCINSTNTPNGAELWGSGTPSVVNDDVVLTVEGMPASSFVHFLQGTPASAVPFGDGHLCLTGSLVRIALRPSIGGVASYPGSGDEPISVRGGIPPAGATVAYQARFRDNATWCTPATFNTSNGYRVVWAP